MRPGDDKGSPPAVAPAPRHDTIGGKQLISGDAPCTAPRAALHSPRTAPALARDLRGLLHHSRVVDEPAERETFSYDASFMTQVAPHAPDVAVIAGSVDDIQALMRFAWEH